MRKPDHFDIEREHNAGRDIPQADCMSRVHTEERCLTNFVAASTKNFHNTDEASTNPRSSLQNTDRRSIQKKPKQIQKTFASLYLVRNQTPTNSVKHDRPSEELWSFWVDSENHDLGDGLLYRRKFLETSGHSY